MTVSTYTAVTPEIQAIKYEGRESIAEIRSFICWHIPHLSFLGDDKSLMLTIGVGEPFAVDNGDYLCYNGEKFYAMKAENFKRTYVRYTAA